ncbi:MAG: carboxyl transferase domain-containing protein [Ilumatobacteraceae bacterium]
MPSRTEVCSPLQGTVVSVEVAVGASVAEGEVLALVESMKMHHPVVAPCECTVVAVAVAPGTAVGAGDVVAVVEALAAEASGRSPEAGATVGTASPGAVADPPTSSARADLLEVRRRHDVGLDGARPDAVARRHQRGRRTARENIADLLDDGSFVEYGPLVLAAQRRRRPLDELIAATPADGLVGGIGTVGGRPVVAVSYDYTVLAGTQGGQNHRKKDRLFELAAELRLPVVLFAEGGGGRPGDTDLLGPSGLDCAAFGLFAELSGLVPLVGIASGYCFAGNAALLGCCDVVIATTGSNIGMGGPAMIEGGGLGVHRPGEIGPVDDQFANGVVDILCADDASAVGAARQYLGYFPATPVPWTCVDQSALRDAVPLDRKRAYDVRAVVQAMFDEDSVLELRSGFGRGIVTALARVEGRSVGVIANNPAHLGGAIDSDGSDKAARFMQLCDAFDMPIVTLVDTPGMMVGPDVERTALVRHCSRLFVTGANVSVPLVSIVLRKSYGLGAQAMMGGSTKAPLACVAWPTGEFGGMGLEGAVRLGYRRELEAIADEAEREALFQRMVDHMYEIGTAVNVASHFEIDDVIDPADSRRWIAAVLAAAPPPAARAGKKRSNVDTW